MTTRIAVLTHPEVDEDHPMKLLNGNRLALRRTSRMLEEYIGEKQVAVLASPTIAGTEYAKRVAGHFFTEVTECEDLLRDQSAGIEECHECVDTYLHPNFGLVIVLAARDISKPLAHSLADQVGRPLEEIRIPGMTHVYVI